MTETERRDGRIMMKEIEAAIRYCAERVMSGEPEVAEQFARAASQLATVAMGLESIERDRARRNRTVWTGVREHKRVFGLELVGCSAITSDGWPDHVTVAQQDAHGFRVLKQYDLPYDKP